MKSPVDLRFVVAPLLRILLLLGLDDDHPSKLKTAISLVLGLLLFLFLFLLTLISVKLPLTITLHAEPICLRAGDFYSSVPIAVTFLASFLCPESLFRYVYLVCFGISPFSGLLLNKLNRFLQAIPTFFIVRAPTAATGQQEGATAVSVTVTVQEPELPPQSGGVLNVNQDQTLSEQPLYPENEDMDMGIQIV